MGQSQKSFQKNLPFIFFLVMLNALFAVFLVSFAINRNGFFTLTNFLSVPASSISLGAGPEMNSSEIEELNSKIDEFRSSKIEKLEMSFSESQVNYVLEKYLNRKKEEKLQDIPVETPISETGMNLLGIGKKSSEIETDLNGSFYKDLIVLSVSYDSGKKWRTVGISVIPGQDQKPEFRLNFVSPDIFDILKKSIENDFNKGLEDSFEDYNSKIVNGRKIKEIRVEEGRIILIGVISE